MSKLNSLVLALLLCDIALADNFKASKVVGGLNHTCAIKLDKTVACWGENTVGQLGLNEYGNAYAIPQSVILYQPESEIRQSLTEIVDLAGFGRRTFALNSSGDVFWWAPIEQFYSSWAANYKNPPQSWRASATKLDLPEKISAIAASDGFGCMISKSKKALLPRQYRFSRFERDQETCLD